MKPVSTDPFTPQKTTPLYFERTENWEHRLAAMQPPGEPEVFHSGLFPNQRTRECALEVIVSFGTSVLHVAHLSPPRSFSVGQSQDGLPVDVEIPKEAVGRTRLEVIRVRDETAYLLIPDGAAGSYRKERTQLGLDEVYHHAASSEDAPRVRAIPLALGAQVHMELPGITLRLAVVELPTPLPRGLLANWDWAVPGYFGASLGTFASLLGTMAFFAPPLGLMDDEGLDQKRLLLLSQYLDSAAERERSESLETREERGSDAGEEAQRAMGQEGEAGKEHADRKDRRSAVNGPKNNPDLHLSREKTLADAQEFGLVGMLNAAMTSDPLAPASVFARDRALGSDDVSAEGNMWGDAIGESGGRGGLGFMGHGFGGGDLFGDGIGIGMKAIGTVGGGAGRDGFGTSVGRPGGTHEVRTPRMATKGETIVSGRIPAHVIQRVVRQNFGRFRMCYERGLGRNPNLEGRVTIRFVIGADGAVSTASPAGDMPDGDVKRCVASAFYGLSFPPPDGGVVRVAYPLMFSPQ